jgi:hypothetical protein
MRIKVSPYVPRACSRSRYFGRQLGSWTCLRLSRISQARRVTGTGGVRRSLAATPGTHWTLEGCELKREA